jgi:NADPH-dependent 2,4-dienoyl-CoA reductase/sulfur reductase-like enzyme
VIVAAPLRRVVVVGASLAGTRAAEALRAEGFDGDLVVIGAEPHRPYDRPPLSKAFLGGAVTEDEIRLTDPAAASAGIEWRPGTQVTGVDLAARALKLASGQTVAFDGLVIASGAAAWVPSGLDAGLAGVHVLRTLDDARALRADLSAAPGRVVVIGAGFIGCELASTVRAAGLAVTVVEPAERPLQRVVGPLVGDRVQRMLADHGVHWKLGVIATRLRGERRVTGVELSDGTTVPADVVVIAVGVRPATQWLAGSGVDVRDGVRCDDTLRALDAAGRPVPGVVAAGDVARWPHPVFGGDVRVEHWTNAAMGAAVAARTLLDPEAAAPHDTLPSFWSDQCGVRIQGVGLPARGTEVEIAEGSLEDLKFLARYYHAGRQVAAVAMNMTKQLVREGRRIVDGRIAVELAGLPNRTTTK